MPDVETPLEVRCPAAFSFIKATMLMSGADNYALSSIFLAVLRKRCAGAIGTNEWLARTPLQDLVSLPITYAHV